MSAQDWATAKAAEVLALILNPGVTLDNAAWILAEELRLADAIATERALRSTPEDVQNEFERA